MKKFILAVTFSSFLFASAATYAEGPSNASTTTSLGLSLATGSLVAGSIQTLAGSGHLVVTSVEKIGEGSVVVLKNLADGSIASVRIVGSATGAVSVGVGTVVTASAYASGFALIVSGKVIAYIPNEIGKALLYSKKTADRSSRS